MPRTVNVLINYSSHSSLCCSIIKKKETNTWRCVVIVFRATKGLREKIINNLSFFFENESKYDSLSFPLILSYLSLNPESLWSHIIYIIIRYRSIIETAWNQISLNLSLYCIYQIYRSFKVSIQSKRPKKFCIFLCQSKDK